MDTSRPQLSPVTLESIKPKKPTIQMMEIYSNDGLHKQSPFMHVDTYNDMLLVQVKHQRYSRKIRHLLPRGPAGLRLCLLHKRGYLIRDFIDEAKDYRPMTRKERKQLRKCNKARRRMVVTLDRVMQSTLFRTRRIELIKRSYR